MASMRVICGTIRGRWLLPPPLVQYERTRDCRLAARPMYRTRLQLSRNLYTPGRCGSRRIAEARPGSIPSGVWHSVCRVRGSYRFGRSSRSDVREQVARSLGTKGVALRQLGRPEAAIAIYDEVASRFGRAWEPDIVLTVARTAVSRAVAFRALVRWKEEIAAYDDVLDRFGEATEPRLRAQVAMALAL